MLKAGFLRAGRIAGVHATPIATNPGSTLVGKSDININIDGAAKVAARFGAEARTPDAILNDPAIDAVLISNSTDTHSYLIERTTAAPIRCCSKLTISTTARSAPTTDSSLSRGFLTASRAQSFFSPD
jgi:hypothetical protein